MLEGTNKQPFQHADTLADLEVAQRFGVIVFVRSEGSFFRYDTDALAWVRIGVEEADDTPRGVPNLVFWFEARDADAVDGAPVTALPDKSANGFDLDSVNGTTYRANAGEPYLDLELAVNSTGGFDADSVLDVASPASFSSFWIARHNTAGAGEDVTGFMRVGNSGGNMVRILLKYLDGRCYYCHGNEGTGGGQPSHAAFAEQTDDLFHVWEFHRLDNVLQVFVDGVEVTGFTNSNAFENPSLVDDGPVRCTVFGSGDLNGGQSHFKAGIVYNRFISGAERETVRAYLETIP